MHHLRLVGGLAALAVLLILCTAPAALAASLPLIWSGTISSADSAGFTSVATGPDGAVYAAGYTGKNDADTSSHLLLVKYVDAGATMSAAWSVTLPGEYTSAAKVAVDAQGDVVVAGTRGAMAFQGAGSDILLLKFSAAGDQLWRKTWDGAAHRTDYVKDLALDADGNAIVVGASAGGKTGRDYITVKFTASGSCAWARRYAGPSDFDEARSVAVDPTGNVYVTGQSRVPASKPGISGPPRAVTMSYSPVGVRRWIVRGSLKEFSSGAAIMYCDAAGAKGVVLAGWRYYGSRKSGHTFFTKYTTGGGVIWTRTPTAGTRSDDWPEAAALNATGAPIAAGARQRPLDQAWLTGTSATGGDVWQSTFQSAFSNPSWAEFGSVAVAADGRVLAAGDTVSGEMGDIGEMPTAFLVRYSPGVPVAAPLDYVGAGDATTADVCTAVAIGADGMYAVGHQGSTTGDSDAAILKF
jgi:hypothetical protein